MLGAAVGGRDAGTPFVVGHPLLLVHGYPETRRIWWRNVKPLVEAGYEVIVPGCGHFLQWEHADVLNEVVKFYFADLRSS
jgi:pimeloyl-ACP methyl ester carboxylesterase